MAKEKEKKFDPIFHRFLTDAIDTQKKITDKYHTITAYSVPHKVKVQWDEDPEDDCNIDEDDESYFEDDRLSCSSSVAPVQHSSVQRNSVNEKERESIYVFPRCTFCDFGWKFGSGKKLVCPRHAHLDAFDPWSQFPKNAEWYYPYRTNNISPHGITED